ANPVPINPNTTYVISYFAPNGSFSYNLSYFASSGTNTPPLHALASGVDGTNGLYIYGSASTFPTQSYSSTNYWVDVVFTTTAGSAPPSATNLVLVSGNNQTGTAGQSLASPFVVKVTDANGNPVSGISVSFAVAGGGGTLSAGSAVTDTSGLASAALTLG